MNVICNHIETSAVICETCKIFVCVDCLINDFNIHRHHSLITSKRLIYQHKKFVQNSIIKLSLEIEAIEKEITSLNLEKNKLQSCDSDTVLLSFLNTTNIECVNHNSKGDVVCNQCKVCLCVKCLIDLNCHHRDHHMTTIEDKITELVENKKDSIMDLENKLNDLILNKDKITCELNANKLIVASDSEILNNYLAKDKINSKNEYNENHIYELYYAIDNGLKWSLESKLITENCDYTLGPGYYMIVAVGGGASSGVFQHVKRSCGYYCVASYGGECGEITAKILQITKNTELNIVIGKCIKSKKSMENGTDFFTKCYSLQGSNTQITFGENKIVAVGGNSVKYNNLTKETFTSTKSIFDHTFWNVYSREKMSDIFGNNIKIINNIANIFPVVYTCPNISILNNNKVTSGYLKKKGEVGESGLCLANIDLMTDNCVNILYKTKGFGAGCDGSSLISSDSNIIEPTDVIYGTNGTGGCVIIVYLH